MRVVGLISGGKDSCFNLMHCVSEGHELVALGNLRPADRDELDSYMYQTVGHHAIDLYAEAMGLPLYRRTISGTAVETGRDYIQTSNDEVEDLFLLLQQIKNDGIEFEAVSVGAILSDYQRVRVENVCNRLGLTSLAYLWRRDQKELLSEMIQSQVKAIVIKVATLGLTPNEHLGKPIEEIYDHLVKMSAKFGLNVCGEGGEYETFTLDCPLFVKSIVLEEAEIVIHSADAFAPVAYLNLKKLHLVDKSLGQVSVRDRLHGVTIKRSHDFLLDLYIDDENNSSDDISDIVDPLPVSLVESTSVNHAWTIAEPSVSFCKTSGLVSVCGILANSCHGDLSMAVESVLDLLTECLQKKANCHLTDVVSICIFVSDIGKFAAINDVYRKYFPSLPPVRVCVQTYFPASVLFQLDCIAFQRHGCEAVPDFMEAPLPRHMHVQSVSFWAPANIGPYSQTVLVGHRLFVAGQIGLCPSTMLLVDSALRQSRIALRHVCRVLDATCTNTGLRDVVLAICYATSHGAMQTAQTEWNHALQRSLNSDIDSSSDDWQGRDGSHIIPLVQYVVVPALPRSALVEWQVTALTQVTNCKFGSFSESFASFPLLLKIQCQWSLASFDGCSSGGDFLSFVLTVDANTDHSSLPRKSIIPQLCFHDILSSALSHLKMLLNSSHEPQLANHGCGMLRVFACLARFTPTDIYEDCRCACQSVFGSDMLTTSSVAMPTVSVVPVCQFLLSSTVLSVCPA